jgi:hypothetical protein
VKGYLLIFLPQGVPVFITPTATSSLKSASEPTLTTNITTGQWSFTYNPFTVIPEVSKWEMQIQIPLIFIPLLIFVCLVVAKLTLLLVEGYRNKRGNKKEKCWDEEKDGHNEEELHPFFRLSSDLPGLQTSAIMTEMEQGDEKRVYAVDVVDEENDLVSYLTCTCKF